MKKNFTASYSLVQLKNNPMYFAELISCTCLGFKMRKANILDIYLILPILLYEAGITNLKNASTKSSIQSVFLNNNVVGLAGLQNRIDRLNGKSIESFILAINMNLISLDYNTLEIELTRYGKRKINEYIKDKKRLFKEARNLGKILSRNEVKENYRLLGVKKI